MDEASPKALGGHPRSPAENWRSGKPSPEPGVGGLHPRRVTASCRDAETRGSWELPFSLPSLRTSVHQPGPPRRLGSDGSGQNRLLRRLCARLTPGGTQLSGRPGDRGTLLLQTRGPPAHQAQGRKPMPGLRPVHTSQTPASPTTKAGRQTHRRSALTSTRHDSSLWFPPVKMLSFHSPKCQPWKPPVKGAKGGVQDEAPPAIPRAHPPACASHTHGNRAPARVRRTDLEPQK